MRTYSLALNIHSMPAYSTLAGAFSSRRLDERRVWRRRHALHAGSSGSRRRGHDGRQLVINFVVLISTAQL